MTDSIVATASQGSVNLHFISGATFSKKSTLIWQMQDNNPIDDTNDRGASMVGALSLADSIRALLSEGVGREIKVPALTHGQQVYKLLLNGQFGRGPSDPKTSG